MSFTSAINRFATLTKAAGEKIVRETERDLYSAIVLQTPVKEGFARGNWFPSISAPSSETTDVPDKSGAATVAKIVDELNAASFPRKAYISNNLPYIERLETGWSGLAPDGMVKINVERAKVIFARKIQAYKV